MSEVDKDPFDESSWGNLRFTDAVRELIGKAKNAMVELADCFAVESPDSPRLEFKADGELPSIGQFVTPLGSAEVRLSLKFFAAQEGGDPDDFACNIRVFVPDVAANGQRSREVDWHVELAQYGAAVVHSGSSHRLLSGNLNTSRLRNNRYQAGMALYRAIAEKI
ncbi:hypothetical protein [Achromobacter sp. 2789STDY5608615]|uniref:hypothetical protein n=1 Tax=Achromobacter sp. 2789STDY5608615 TaxID=1806492 RepID=UPI0012E23CA9|nr:hypothetical protein [Achromobacter sp. 2789STDY5608615]